MDHKLGLSSNQTPQNMGSCWTFCSQVQHKFTKHRPNLTQQVGQAVQIWVEPNPSCNLWHLGVIPQVNTLNIN